MFGIKAIPVLIRKQNLFYGVANKMNYKLGWMLNANTMRNIYQEAQVAGAASLSEAP